MIKKILNFFIPAVLICWLIGLALVLRWSVLEVYVLPFHGMLPTLFPNDHIIVNKMSYGLKLPFSDRYLSKWSSPKRGEVVVFRSPFDIKSLSIRRVVGVPGDRIFFENGRLYINEQEVKKHSPSVRAKDFSYVRDEDFSDQGLTEDKSHYQHYEERLSDYTYSILLKKKRQGYLIFGPYRLPPGHYFVLGDHRDRVQDSRTWPSRLKKAEGEATFYREQAGPPVPIAKGTLLSTSDPQLPEYFETTKQVSLTDLNVTVGVRAKKAGLAGNVPAGHINKIETWLKGHVRVKNTYALTGGDDKNLVAEKDILGKVSWVWFSCSKTIKYVPFLCHPGYVRWDRVFFPVHQQIDQTMLKSELK